VESAVIVDLGGVPEDLHPYAENVIRSMDENGTQPPKGR
jgi:hypothetical protein